jgi:hypothetical protein
MTATPQNSPQTATGVELAPNFTLPLAILAGSVPLLFVNRWAGGCVGLFSLFLLVQAATIRLNFTDTALEVYRSGTQIRNFPYTDWQNWRVFWPSLPILFYFREVNSIHFLPVLFDPAALHNCLQDLPRVD